MADRSVSVALKAQVDNYVTGMKKAEAGTKLLQKQLENTRRESLLLSKTAQLTAGIAGVAIGKKLVDAASDLNETMSKTRVVFGDASDAVLEWSQSSATALGMSRQQAAESAASFGNLFVSMKLGAKPAADMSMRLVQLASDLASFNNIDPQQALDALRSGLVGETEPLRALGVNMNDATLRAEALKLGLIQTTSQALDPAVKAQAAYALILEQTTTAQGDFKRTSDGLANSQRIFNAELSDAEAALGQTLLPALTTGVHGLTAFLGAFNALPDPIKAVLTVTGALAAGLLILAPRIVATKAALSELGASSSISAKGVGKATLAIAALAGAVALIDHFTESAINGGKGANEMADALERLAATGEGVDAFGFDSGVQGARSFNDALQMLADNHWTDQVGTWAAHLVGAQTTFDDAAASVDGVDKALAAMVADGNVKGAAEAFKRLRDQWVAAGGDAAVFDSTLNDYRDAVAGAKDKTDVFAGVLEAAGIKASGAADEVKTLKDKIDQLRGTAMASDEATSNLEAAIDSATDAVKENGRAVGESTPAARANSAALRDLATAALDGVDAWNANGVSADQIATKTQKARDAFIETAVKMGYTKAQAKKLADQYGLIPTQVKTTVTADGAQAKAEAAAVEKRWKTAVAYIAQHPAKYNAIMGTGPRGGFATGGYVSGPGTGTSDSVNARLSNGEYVLTASTVRRVGRGNLDALNYGYASGGFVSAAPAQSTDFTITAPVQLVQDSAVVWQGLLRLRKSRGGVALGIG